MLHCIYVYVYGITAIQISSAILLHVLAGLGLKDALAVEV